MKMYEEKQEDGEKITKPQDEKFSKFELSILHHDIFIKMFQSSGEVIF